jgi:hypothetical protein
MLFFVFMVEGPAGAVRFIDHPPGEQAKRTGNLSRSGETPFAAGEVGGDGSDLS